MPLGFGLCCLRVVVALNEAHLSGFPFWLPDLADLYCALVQCAPVGCGVRNK